MLNEQLFAYVLVLLMTEVVFSVKNLCEINAFYVINTVTFICTIFIWHCYWMFCLMFSYARFYNCPVTLDSSKQNFVTSRCSPSSVKKAP